MSSSQTMTLQSSLKYKLETRPILKWAGGKTQMLSSIIPKIPLRFGTYIEPFFGGGALFFNIRPHRGIIADSNPELINMYQQVASNVETVITFLSKYENNEEVFYRMREEDWTILPPAQAAARMIFLNKTCFNGLYRVNRKGNFNVPFGRYKNPTICDTPILLAASESLKRAKIVCGDYLQVLEQNAKPNDFIFLDPPYLPISQYSDFKRYTKEQFHEEDHILLASEAKRLSELGCHVILTNSNHSLVYELYKDYDIEIVPTKRYISCNGKNRNGEDVIVTIPPKRKIGAPVVESDLSVQMKNFPPTRFMGSKSKLLPEILKVASRFEFDTVIDLFAGSCVVGYMFKAMGKTVISNDYMSMSATFAKAMIENNETTLSLQEAQKLLRPNEVTDNFVAKTFRGLYFSDEENILIDNVRANIKLLEDKYKQAIAMSALIRACIKKRPRGIFTYTGERYNDGRRDLKISLGEQFIEAVSAINNAVFNNQQLNVARWGDAMSLTSDVPNLIYIDPPYYSPLSDNEYVRRYHFVEGLARDWNGVEIQNNTQTKKFKSYPTPFSTRKGAADAFDHLFEKFSSSILIVSYSSNSLPSLDEMVAILAKYKPNVEVVPIDHRYSFGNQATKVGNNKNKVQEYLFVGY